MNKPKPKKRTSFPEKGLDHQSLLEGNETYEVR